MIRVDSLLGYLIFRALLIGLLCGASVVLIPIAIGVVWDWLFGTEVAPPLRSDVYSTEGVTS